MKMKWISVKEKMPAQDGYTGHVLVARFVGYDPRFGDMDVVMARFDGKGWCNDYGSVQKYGEEITHWMPIPEPPPSGELHDEIHGDEE